MVITAVVAGIAASAFGAYKAYTSSKEMAAASQQQAEIGRQQQAYQQQQIAAEQRAEAARNQAMQLDARRRSLETIRNAQRTRSLSLATATAQGAAYGSGLQGGYGQISGQANTSLTGISQNLQIGNSIFGYNNDISNARMGVASLYGAQVGAQSAYNQAASSYQFGMGLASLGGSLVGNAPTLGNIFGYNRSA